MVVSVTEGQYMVKKHPHMFLGADVVVINKIDLAEAMGSRPVGPRRAYAQAGHQGHSSQLPGRKGIG